MGPDHTEREPGFGDPEPRQTLPPETAAKPATPSPEPDDDELLLDKEDDLLLDGDNASGKAEVSPEQKTGEPGGEAEPIEKPLDEAVDEASRDNTRQRRDEVGKQETIESIIGIIDTITGSEDAQDRIRQIAAEQLIAAIPDLSAETARERVAQAEKYIAGLKIESSGFDVTAQEAKVIKQIIIEPLLRGHVSDETLLYMVGKVTIIDSGQAQAASQKLGYQARAFSDCQGSITISREILDPNFRNAEGGKLNIRHMITHEGAHTAIENLLQARPENEQEQEMHKELIGFSNEVIKLAELTKSSRIPQPQHIDKVLDMVAGLKTEYQNANPPKTEKFEDFQKARLAAARREILTDYAAIYLQSDGSKESFALGLMNTIRTESLLDYFKVNAGDEISEDDLEAQLADLRSTPPEGLPAKIEKYPAMKQAVEMYGRIYEITSKNITDDRIKHCAEIRLAQGDMDPDEAAESWESVGSFPMGNRAGSAQNKQEALGNAAKTIASGLVPAVEEVNVLSGFSR